MPGADPPVTWAIDPARDLTLALDASNGSARVVEAGNVSAAVELSQERLLIVEGHWLSVLDSAGAQVWRVGGEGEGPREFRGLGLPCQFAADTVSIVDHGNRRLVTVEHDSGIVGVTPHPPGAPDVKACSHDGAMLLATLLAEPRSRNGDLVVHLAHISQHAPVPIARLTVPVGIRIGHGAASMGLSRSFVYVADPDAGTISIRTHEGELVRTLRWGAKRIEVTDENIPTYHSMLPGVSTPADLERWWQRMRNMRRMDYWPAFGAVQVDEDGHLWVTQFDDPGTVWVITAEGRLLGRVDLPTGAPQGLVTIVGFVWGKVVLRYEDRGGMPRLGMMTIPSSL